MIINILFITLVLPSDYHDVVDEIVMVVYAAGFVEDNRLLFCHCSGYCSRKINFRYFWCDFSIADGDLSSSLSVAEKNFVVIFVISWRCSVPIGIHLVNLYIDFGGSFNVDRY